MISRIDHMQISTIHSYAKRLIAQLGTSFGYGIDVGITSSEFYRRRKISDILTLVAIGSAGNSLIMSYPDIWEQKLDILSGIDWKKSNPTWENLVFVNGKVAANRSTQHAMSKYMKDILLETAGTDDG